MNKLELGRSGLMVSEICLGTMTWGTQNTEAEAHDQIDMAQDHGVNFMDTAEMYPTNPVSAETIGLTEDYIGSWVTKSGRRDDWIIATKITGSGQDAIRDGAPITPQILTEAVHSSLRRLRTDVIDLYQIHWPNRGSYHFRKHWGYDPSAQNREETVDHMQAVLETVQGFVKAGKIRHFALSNETAWGTAQWLRLAEEQGLPRVQSIQNEYSLLCRHYDTDLAELSVNEDVTLLAYSPLATGLLTGKYAGDVVPEGTRRARNPDLGGRITPRVFEAVAAYMAVANAHGLDPAQMALAWCRQRPFPVIPIIGATDPRQLTTALGSAGMVLSDAVMADLNAAYRAHPMPY